MYEKLSNPQLYKFFHLPGNQMALSSQDEFLTASTTVSVCTEIVQTVKPGKKRMQGKDLVETYHICDVSFHVHSFCLFPFKSVTDLTGDGNF